MTNIAVHIVKLADFIEFIGSVPYVRKNNYYKNIIYSSKDGTNWWAHEHYLFLIDNDGCFLFVAKKSHTGSFVSYEEYKLLKGMEK